MPLVKAAPMGAPTPPAAPARLDGADADERRRAARALADDPAAAPLLANHLAAEPDPRVRDALFAGLVQIGGPGAAALIAPFLGSGDAALRGGAVDALRVLAEDALPALDRLLDDADPDIRLLAIEVARALPNALAVPRLRAIIDTDPHVNVCAAAIDVATELGTPALLEPLARLRTRFADEPFIGFAIDIACRRIHAAGPGGT